MYVFALTISSLAFAVLLVIYACNPRASMFNPVTYYLLTHALIFVIRPWVAYFYDYTDIYDLYGFFPSEGTRLIVAFGSLLGLAAFTLPAMLALRRYGNALPPQTGSLVRKDYVPAFLATCVLLLPIGLLSLGTTIDTKVAGTTSMMMVDGISVNTDQNGYFLTAQMVLGPMAAIFAWMLRFRIWSLLPMAAFVVAKAATGGRFPIVMALFTLVILYLVDRGRRWPSMPLMAAGALALVAFGLIGQDRGLAVRSFLGLDSGATSQRSADYFAKRPLEGMDFANKEYFEYVVHGIPEKSGTYGYFLDNLQLLTEPIPRLLWPDKPIGAPIKMYDLWAWGSPIGITLTLPGEGWAQAGWAGIVIWCGFWGAIFGMLYRRFLQAEANVFAVALYASFIPLVITFVRDGLMITLFRTALFTVLPVIIWFLVHRFFFRTPTARRSAGVASTRRSVENHGI